MKGYILEKTTLTGATYKFNLAKGNLELIARNESNNYREKLTHVPPLASGDLKSLKIYEVEVDEQACEVLYDGDIDGVR